MSTPLSLKAAWQKAARNPGPLAAGLRSWSRAGPEAFPFSSVRSLIGAFQWPGGFSYSNESPSEVTTPQGPSGDWNPNVEGIVRDDQY